MQKFLALLLTICCNTIVAQSLQTTFEKSKGLETTTYDDCIQFYKKLSTQYNTIQLKEFGKTDAGYPLHLIVFSKDKTFSPTKWQNENKVVILVNNGIHPGEPDGIDASMMLLRDAAIGKINIPNNVIIAAIAVYNIGGCLNRNSYTRVNQNGPLAYGFRGNAQNLDLNRDFIKSDSKEAQTFAQIFHYFNPDIFMDNHVSDGADYQHTMTLLTTQQSKLGGPIGNFLHSVFEPALYKGMKAKKWDMCPYVNFETANVDKGWTAFYDAPRYSSGYTSLFATMGFVPETHMLKPFADRVKSTYDLMQTMIEQAAIYAKTIKEKRAASLKAIQQQQQFALQFKVDTTRFDAIEFKGYTAQQKPSFVSGLDRLYYNHDKPFTKQVKFYNYFTEDKIVTKPKAYIIPQGWHAVIERLQLNKVAMKSLQKDTMIQVEAYRIEDYKTITRPYEKHYRHYDVKVSKSKQEIQFLKGDIIIYTGQMADRFLVETLEPTSDDGYFAWNFFDAILQQKEGYSDYRWEDVAAAYLEKNTALQTLLQQKRKQDSAFAKNGSAQLDFVYKNSPYYESAHLRYSIYRLVD